jgi:hypothetical protein
VCSNWSNREPSAVATVHRQGVHIARSTMCDWVEQVADLVRPVTDAMAKAARGASDPH